MLGSVGTPWAPFIFLGGLAGLLVVVTIIRVRKAVAVARWVTDTMDGSTRWIAAIALVPGLALMVLTIVDGLEPPVAVILGLVCALGSGMALLGAFGMEGVLLEKESEAAIRIAERRAPPSSPLGRVVAIVLGSVIAGATVIPPWFA